MTILYPLLIICSNVMKTYLTSNYFFYIKFCVPLSPVIYR
jgi:hypothetical protein